MCSWEFWWWVHKQQGTRLTLLLPSEPSHLSRRSSLLNTLFGLLLILIRILTYFFVNMANTWPQPLKWECLRLPLNWSHWRARFIIGIGLENAWHRWLILTEQKPRLKWRRSLHKLIQVRPFGRPTGQAYNFKGARTFFAFRYLSP